ncbi:hypothetical protein H2203_003253 [Taxawa tesnikishii (nom. ined.)]|nr:hypothetical protein H2203_003253 [Dothideales sp. JES 119]
MRFDFAQTPRPLLHLLTFLLTTTTTTVTAYPKDLKGLTWDALFPRGSDCSNPCGWSGQLCCASDQVCYTDSNNQAQCSSTAYAAATTAAGGYWQYYTTTYVETDLITVTKVMSTYMAGQATTVVPAVATTASCNYANNETPCGNICCASNQGSSSGYYSTYYSTQTQTAGAPLRPTSSTLVVVTATSSPTTTVPFEAPVATGANVTLTTTSAESTNTGLSGGAIAGIVIGVLLGILLLALICFYLFVKAGVRGIAALFGGGRRRRTVEREEYIEEHHHRSSGGAGGRTWYGSGRPSRVEVERRDEKKKKGGNALPIAAGLAGLAAFLGLKRARDRRRDDEKSDWSSSYGSYYTSESEHYPPLPDRQQHRS